tara:strand:+ start:936 stop:1121 length:186 start_codon:yes stop_codon:yes gene_type:complete
MDISIFKPGGKGRHKNLVFFDVSGGMENVLDEKLKLIRLLFLLGSNLPLPPPPEALYAKGG